jgi:hypothetical protein
MAGIEAIGALLHGVAETAVQAPGFGYFRRNESNPRQETR